MKTLITMLILCSLLWADRLPSWSNGSTKETILHFLSDLSDSSSKNFVAPEERRACFDLDGTILCEKPTYVEVAFILNRMHQLIKRDSARLSQPMFAAIAQNDTAYINSNIMDIILRAYEGETLETVHRDARTFLTTQKNSKLNRPYIGLLYQPMLELFALLQSLEFEIYLVSTSQQEYIRAFMPTPLALPKSAALSTMVGFTEAVSSDSISFVRTNAYFTPYCADAGKVVRLRERGLFPLQIAAGNTIGDYPMLDAVEKKNSGPSLQLVINHDDKKREFSYGDTALLDSASQRNWTVVSMKHDFKTIFAPLKEIN